MKQGLSLAIALLAFAIMLIPAGLATGKGGSAAGDSTDCTNADQPVISLSSSAARKAIACLINDERRRHARRPLKRNGVLENLAQKHTKKMVQTDCLGHRCPGEDSLENRFKNSDYVKGASGFRYGENTGCAVSPGAMVANWMASRFHRRNILDKGFRDFGIGVDNGRVESRCSEGFGTFTADFGFRKG